MRLIPFDYAVRNLGRSPRRSAGILLGNTLVVLLIVAAASFVEGMRASFSAAPHSRNVILLGAGSEESLERSEIPARTPGIVGASLQGIRTEGGVPFVSPEALHALVLLPEKNSTEKLRAIVRGVTPGAFLVHSRVEILEGRVPRPGANELMAGSLAADKLDLPPGRLAIGQSFWFEDQEWRIVGRFKARGTVMDAELWTALNDLKIATKRETISCVVVTLDKAEFADVDAFTKMRVDLELSAITESDYYASLLRFFRPLQIMIWTTAILVALAGILGGFNTLYCAFAARVRELAMLQSLGFARRAIVLSLIEESLLTAAVAVLLALGLAMLFLDGYAISYSMGVFQLALTNVVLAAGAATGVFIAILGSLPPAWRCLRMPIPEALKSL